jgi:exosome complex component RRP4
MTLSVENKDIVVPGQVLCEGMDHLPGTGTYRMDEKVYAKRLGLVSIDGRAIKIIPLSGRYIPRKHDVIICQVFDIQFGGWRVETNSAYSAMLNLKEASSSFIARGADLSQIFQIGDYMMCQVINVTSQKLIDVTLKGPGLKKLSAGRVIEVSPHKVPRIIGKQGSMISMIKQSLSCNILVGQNGVVWIDAEPQNELRAIETLRIIESQSHIPGLTEKIKSHLGKYANQGDKK